MKLDDKRKALLQNREWQKLHRRFTRLWKEIDELARENELGSLHHLLLLKEERAINQRQKEILRKYRLPTGL